MKLLVSKRSRLLILTLAGIVFLWMFLTPIQDLIEQSGIPAIGWLFVGGIGTLAILSLGVKVL